VKAFPVGWRVKLKERLRKAGIAAGAEPDNLVEFVLLVDFDDERLVFDPEHSVTVNDDVSALAAMNVVDYVEYLTG
jgi:hypothetical protein